MKQVVAVLETAFRARRALQSRVRVGARLPRGVYENGVVVAIAVGERRRERGFPGNSG